MLRIIEEYYKSIDGIAPFVDAKIEKLKRHPDIMEQFARWIENGECKLDGIELEGYAAKELATQSRYMVGERSFLFLVELRENTEKARGRISDDLKMK